MNVPPHELLRHAAPESPIRLFLLHGEDQSASAALARQLEAAFGPDSERVDLRGDSVRDQPSTLADEAASISLFGGARHVRVFPAGDEIAQAVATLLEAPVAGNPVIAIAGPLGKASKLLDAAAGHALAACCHNMPLKGERLVEEAVRLAGQEGVRMPRDIAASLADLCGGDRGILAREIEKLALYLDASPQSPKEASHQAIEAVGAESLSHSWPRLADLVFAGRPGEAAAELAVLDELGIADIPRLRSLAQRVMQLVEGGGRSHHSPPWLARAAERLLEAERTIKRPKSPGPVVADAEALALARAAAQSR